ncbi:MAG TPA: universal stress protein [Vicinamibacterales bacterium]
MTIPTIARVLVGLDFDDASAAALKTAAVFARAWGATLSVLHAANDNMPTYFTASQLDQLEAEREQSRAAVARRVREFAEGHVGAAVAVTIGEGPAQDAIVRVAPQFDVIVIGTHQRHGLARWWLGSVAEAIVQHSPRPVMVVPAGAVVSDRPTVLVAGTNPATDAWASELGRAGGDIIDRVLDIDHCTADRLDRADVIVLPLPVETAQRRASHLAQVLEECRHVVLVVPVEPTLERTSS